MSPLAILKFLIERIEAAGYGPLADFVLLLMFIACAYFLIARFFMHKQSKEFAQKARIAAESAAEWYKNETALAPGAEAFRARVAPYVELVGSVYYAIVSLGLCVLILIMSALFLGQAGWLQVVVVGVVGLAFFVMFQIQLARSTWAWNTIKDQRNLTTRSTRTRQKRRAG